MPPFCLCQDVFKQQYSSCTKVISAGNLGLNRKYPKKLLQPLFCSWWNCPLKKYDELPMIASFHGSQNTLQLGSLNPSKIQNK